jgi:hypothetical protein
MRAIEICFFVLALTFSTSIVNEVNNNYYRDYGTYLIPHAETAGLNTTTYDASMNDTLTKYGLDKPPTESESPLGYTAIIDFVVNSTIGFGHMLKTMFFGSMPDSLAYGIDVFVLVNNLLLLVSFIRGIWGLT